MDQTPKNSNVSPQRPPLVISFCATHNDRWIFESVFPGKRNGYFLEAGAADGRAASSCYLLEKKYGWTGICVEPNDAFFECLVKNRSGSICENMCLSGETGTVTYIEGSDDTISPYLGGIKENLESYKHQGDEVIRLGKEVKKEAISLRDLLDRYDAPDVIDYAAFDIEGSELEVLRTFPFASAKFLALSLECDSTIWDPITELLTSNHYVEVKNPFNTDMPWERYWLHESIAR